MARKLEHFLPDDAKPDADARVVVSRTEERRESQRVEAELLALANRLTQLKQSAQDRLGLTEVCTNMLKEIRIIESAPARARALKRLRAELRDVDADQLKRTLDTLNDPRVPRAPDPTSTWCSRLINGNDADLTEFVECYKLADRAQLRVLVRNRVRAKETEQKRAHTRLTQAIRQAMQGSVAAASPSDAGPLKSESD